MVTFGSFLVRYPELSEAQLEAVSGARELPIEDRPGPCFPRPFFFDPILLAE